MRRLTLLWFCCCLLPAYGDDVPPAAVHAAARREAKLKSLMISWKATAFMPKGGRMDADLFGLHLTAPLSRMDHMGLVWLLKGERVALLTETTARLERGGAYYRQGATLPHSKPTGTGLSLPGFTPTRP